MVFAVNVAVAMKDFQHWQVGVRSSAIPLRYLVKELAKS
jgi:hypothetical protein